MKLKSILNEGAPDVRDTIGHYGLILPLGGTDDHIDYDDFESTEVYTRQESFQEAIIEYFYEYSIMANSEREEKFPRGTPFSEIKESPEFQELLEQIWIVDKLGVI